MIGYTQPGKLIVENIKLYQEQWNLASNGYLRTTQYPGYLLNLVAFNLRYSYKKFGSTTMFATHTITKIYIGGGDFDTDHSYMYINNNGNQTFTRFFQALTFDSCDIMTGFFSTDQSSGSSVGLAIQTDGTVTYDPSLTNPYCYLSLAYYLVPMF